MYSPLTKYEIKSLEHKGLARVVGYAVSFEDAKRHAERMKGRYACLEEKDEPWHKPFKIYRVDI